MVDRLGFDPDQEYKYFMGSSDPDQDYIYFMGPKTLPSAIYTLWGRKRFLRYILSDEFSIPFYSTSNGYRVYPFALRVTGIIMV